MTQKEAVLEALASKGIQATCSECRSEDQPVVGQELVMNVRPARDMFNASGPNAMVALTPVVCKHCGYTRLFNTTRLTGEG